MCAASAKKAQIDRRIPHRASQRLTGTSRHPHTTGRVAFPQCRDLPPDLRDPQTLHSDVCDSDNDIMWGDAGTLYWLARPEDLARGDFTNIRFVMQCR